MRWKSTRPRGCRWFANGLLPVFIVCLGGISASQAETPGRQDRLLPNCLQCHAREGLGAPIIARETDWTSRRSQGEETLLRHVIEGYGSMPPSGYCGACSEDDLRALVRRISGLDEGK